VVIIVFLLLRENFPDFTGIIWWWFQITLLKQALKEKVYIGEKGGSGTSKERK